MLGSTKVTKIIFQSSVIQVAIFLICYFLLNTNQQNNTVCMNTIKNLSVLFSNWVSWAVYLWLKANIFRSSRCGAVVNESDYKVAGSTPGLTQWVKDLALL